MKLRSPRHWPLWLQMVVSVGLVVLTAAFCYPFSYVLGHQSVALILLGATSIVAMSLEFWPVFTAALLSAGLWNFLFIPPTLTMQIGSFHDLLMFLMYFLVVMMNGIFGGKMRQAEMRLMQARADENSLLLYKTLYNSLSHELRTPLASLIGGIDFLRNSSVSGTSRDALLDNMADSAHRLNRQVDSMLDMSRLESGQLKPRADWCDLTEIAHFVIRDLSAVSKNHIVIKKHPESFMIKTDGALVKQVIFNLLHNAFSYTPSQTTVELAIEKLDNMAVIRVSDNGPGLEPGTEQLVFEKFYRANSASAGGIGLGLAITKGFCDALGGSIKANSPQIGGVSFEVLLPLST